MENKGNKGRTFILLIFALTASLVLLVRAVILSSSASRSYSDPVVSVRNIRGTIYDRRGNTLAFDTSTTGFLFSSENGLQEAASLIAEYTDLPALEITSLVEGGTYFIPLGVSSLSITDEIESLIAEAGIGDRVSLTTGTYRSSPYTFLDFLLGKSSSSYSGEGGIEEKYNEYLGAFPTLNERTVRGEDLVLTIDLELEEILLSALEKEDVTLSAAILNSRGEILAWRGDAEEELLSAITYSHSDEYETMLFERKSCISLDECTQLSSCYIYLSDTESEALSLIESALRRNGRI